MVNSRHLLSCVLSVLAFGCGTTVIQPADRGLNEGIVVTGTGKVSGRPDLARTTIGVEVRAQTAQAAADQANAKMTELTRAIQALGIEDKDLQTRNFSLNFEQDHRPYPEPTPLDRVQSGSPGKEASPSPEATPPEPRGWYRASNMLEVTVRDLSKLGKLMGTATSVGSNSIFGVEFEIADPTPLRAEARQEAMAEARAKAQQLAQLAGVQLGQVVAIVQESDQSPVQFAMDGAMARVAEAKSAPVESGQIEVVTHLTLRYSIGASER